MLKQLLALNAGTPISLPNFHFGRQVIFPIEQAIRQGTHVVDRETAELFFEVVEYYEAFESEFNRRTRDAFKAMSLETKP